MLAFDDIFDGESGDIIPMLVISVLSEQGDGSLGVVGIQLRHVQVINIKDHSQFSFGSKLLSSLLNEGGFEHILEIGGVSVEIEIDLQVGIEIWHF
jgi:hypothetical protein